MDQPSFQLTRGDAVTWLRALPAASVDLAITDPPHESLEKHPASGPTTRLKHSMPASNDGFPPPPNTRLPDLSAEGYHVHQQDTHVHQPCGPATTFVPYSMHCRA